MTTAPPRPSLPKLTFRQRLMRLPTWIFGTGGLLKTGITGRAGVLAIFSTMSLFFVVNLVLVANVHRSFQSARLTEVAGSADGTEAVERLVRAGLLDSEDSELKNWVKEQLNDRPGRRQAREQVQDLFDGVISISNDGKARRAALLETLSTGQMSGLASRFFWVDTTFPTGADVFDQLADVDKNWRRALERDKLGKAKQRFLIAYLNALLARVQPALREVNRFNGGVKWLATFAAFLLLWAMAGRLYLLVRIQWYWLSVTRAATSSWRARLGYSILSLLHPATGEEQAELLAIADQSRQVPAGPQADYLIRSRMKEVLQTIDSTVYATWSYGVGLLPSLGFIGTVWGLGGALLQANGLFSVSDRQKTIGYITHELGIAFDTTLIALTASVLTGLCVAGLRLRERWLLDQIVNEINRRASTRGHAPPITAPNNTPHRIAGVSG